MCLSIEVKRLCYVYLLLTVASDPGVRGTRPASVNPFTLAEKGKITKEKQNECHRAVTNFVVKGLLPFSTVEAPWWRLQRIVLIS